MIFPGFVGPSYQSQSPIAATDVLINWYPESLETSGETKARVVYYPTPGLQTFAASEGGGPIKAMFSQDGRTFAVRETAFVEVFPDGTTTSYGGVAQDTNPATICSSGSSGGQLFITAGGQGYTFTLATNDLQDIDDPNFPAGLAAQGVYAEGYFLVRVAGTARWQASDLLDGQNWSGLAVAQRLAGSDNIAAIAWVHKELWILGTETSEVWYHSGTGNPPFAPVSGVFLEQGCAASWSVVMMDNTLYWLAQNINGARMVVRADGYTPTRISTHALEYALQSYETIADAIGYSYQDQGHSFYVLTFPAADVTWVYDAATQLWHQRGSWDPVTGLVHAQRAVNHAYAWGTHLVGDRLSGTIFAQSIAFPTDNGDVIRRVRRCPHLWNEQKWVFYDRLGLDLEVGLGSGATPSVTPGQVMLAWSNDGGQTFSQAVPCSAGVQGAYQQRVFWTRLGRARDRVFEVAVSDPVNNWRLTQAFLDVRAGTR